MASLNKVLITGNLTRDPELRHLPNNTAVVDFGVAVDGSYTKNGQKVEATHFVDCTAFAKTAELIHQYFTKGRPILIDGSLRFEQWDDRQSGQKRSKLKVIVDRWHFFTVRKDDDQAGGGQRQHGREDGGGYEGGRGRQRQQSAPPEDPNEIPF